MEMSNGYRGAEHFLLEVNRALQSMRPQVDAFVGALYRAYLEDETIFLIGNGGSASNATHFAQDLNKGTLPQIEAKKRFRAIALTDNVSFITALANDDGYECIFEQQLKTLGRSGNLLVAISGSGNSPNVLRAVEYSNRVGIKTVGVTGFDGGQLKKLAFVNVHIPSHDMGLVEAVHSVLFHLTVSELKQRLSDGRYEEGLNPSAHRAQTRAASQDLPSRPL